VIRGLVTIALAGALVAGCGNKPTSSDLPADDSKPHPKMTEAEVTRGKDACKGYVDKVCACAASKPDLQKPCELAKALPEAVRVSREVSLSPDSSAKDVAQAEDMARKTIKECFEELAKLPTLGCTP